ncbi:hypothetical protein [Fictibacillus gelatini]|uniref:hypothetical protein n=1 Tax=Fictibacillus gelatini TaxID=225985 RepID=UPI0004049AC2|nr:hypothetical protein [Fictibacillus gelatini]
MGKKNCKKVIYCKPKYIYSDTYTEKEVIYVHPIKRINREHIEYVPRHVYEEEIINEVIDPGEPGACGCEDGKKRSSGMKRSTGKRRS